MALRENSLAMILKKIDMTFSLQLREILDGMKKKIARIYENCKA